MRGRKPLPLALAPEDLPVLQHIARGRTLPWLQVQHARILLAVAAGQQVGAVAMQGQCDPSTVWRVCRRYERAGVAAVLADEPRPGRPQQPSPPPEGAGRST